jgi:hypothetical protein
MINLESAKFVMDIWFKTKGCLTPLEFITLNALIKISAAQIDKSILTASSISDIMKESGLPREPIRRAMYSMKERGYVESTNKQWIPR